jgi:hypothetical protein
MASKKILEQQGIKVLNVPICNNNMNKKVT